MAPRGRFLVLVGPDGVGKTTVAEAIKSIYPGQVLYFHFRPTVGGFEDPIPGRTGSHGQHPRDGSQLIGWLRLTVSMLRFWIMFNVSVRPALKRGALVIGDRWAYGYIVTPRALRYFGPPWLARFAIRLLARPDLIANLVAPTSVIAGRKEELSVEEIQRQLHGWSSLDVGKTVTFDLEQSPTEAARAILRALG